MQFSLLFTESQSRKICYCHSESTINRKNILRNHASAFKVVIIIAKKKHACIHKSGENFKDNMHKIKKACCDL